jgi:ribonuclease Y
MLQEAKDQQEIRLLEEKERTQEIETELWTKEEAGLLKSEERIEELEEMTQEKKQKADNQYSVERQKTVTLEAEVLAEEKRIAALETKLNTKKQSLNQTHQDYIDGLAGKLGTPRLQVIDDITLDLVTETQKYSAVYIEQAEADAKEHQENNAKYLIDLALMRFARAYSSERGIAPVYFEAPEQRKVLLDAEGKNLKAISEITGCDIFVEDDMDLIGVAGFDPVRREMTRRILERCLKEKRPITPDFIKDKAEHIKRELLATIKKDGDMIAKELRLEGLHPEIRQMMGSLRYRYSFTQNQYFHCGEVGWLAGLMAQELGTVNVKKARRAGLLHDLGKSMDHQLDGFTLNQMRGRAR